MSIYRSRFDERGATAIEYAIIAGLIGLGLVGSLVTTRGSLSAVFGTASSKMGSATTAGSGQTSTLGPTSMDWASKTLVKKDVYQSGTDVVYTFSDGSKARLVTTDFPTRLYVTDPFSYQYRSVYLNVNGSQTGFNVTQYKPDMTTQVTFDNINGTTVFAGDPPTPPYFDRNYYDVNGNYQSTTYRMTPTPEFIAGSRAALADIQYFLALK